MNINTLTRTTRYAPGPGLLVAVWPHSQRVRQRPAAEKLEHQKLPGGVARTYEKKEK